MQTAKYGFDAPGVMRTFLSLGIIGILAGLMALALIPGWWRVIGIVLLVASFAPLLLGFCMVVYGFFGKHRMRDFMISRIAWRGDERVLDIGTGRGLLLIGAAKKLDTRGQAVGIDIWRQEDLTDNSLEALTVNVAAEGVDRKVTLMTEDARTMSFPDASFDVVLSLYCIHNIEDKAEQKKACFEIARILKPGGRVLVGEYIPTHFYADAFREAGLNVSFSRSFFHVAFAPMWMVEAAKVI
jgi:SAM-dependent methyltransferase